jgi:hypothetical protein
VVAWQDKIDSLLRTCQQVFGEKNPITYRPTSGPDFEISGIFERNFLLVDPNTGASVISTNPIVGVHLEEIDAEISREPDKDDRVIIRGTEFRIIDYRPDGRGDAKLVLHIV